MAHAPNHQQRQDRRVSPGPVRGGSITLDSDPSGIKNLAMNAVAAPITKKISGAIGSAMPAALGGGGAGMAALTPLMGPLALAGIAGKVFRFFNEGTPGVKEQAQKMYQEVANQNNRTMRAPMQYAKGDPDIDADAEEYYRMFGDDRYKELDGILRFPREFDPTDNLGPYDPFDDVRRMMAVPPIEMAIPVFKKGYNTQRSNFYKNRLMKQQPNVDPNEYPELFFNRLPTPKPVMEYKPRIKKLSEGTQYAGMGRMGFTDDEELYEYLRLTDPDRFSPLDGILKFPRELDDSDFIDDGRFGKDPFDLASNTITPAYGSIPVPTYEGDPAQLELFSMPGLPTQSYEEKMYYQDADMGRLNKGTASVEPKQLELFAVPGRQGQSYEEKIYYQDADVGKLNRGTRGVPQQSAPMMSLPADPMMTLPAITIQNPNTASIKSMIAQGRQMQEAVPVINMPNLMGSNLQNIIAHEEFKKNPPYIPMAPLSYKDFAEIMPTGYAKGASGVRSAQGLDNASGGTFVPDFIKPLIEGGSYAPGMPADSIRYQHLYNTGTLPAIQPMPTPGPYIGPLSDRQMKNQLHEQKMMHNEQKHKKQMMTT